MIKKKDHNTRNRENETDKKNDTDVVNFSEITYDSFSVEKSRRDLKSPAVNRYMNPTMTAWWNGWWRVAPTWFRYPAWRRWPHAELIWEGAVELILKGTAGLMEKVATDLIIWRGVSCVVDKNLNALLLNSQIDYFIIHQKYLFITNHFDNYSVINLLLVLLLTWI